MLSRSGSPVTAYSIGFEAEGYDEMEFARIAAKHFGVTHKPYYITSDDLVANIPSWLRPMINRLAIRQCSRPCAQSWPTTTD